ncbi:MAG: hypothetical protein D6795_20910, partial [Deltaproteobacteria bacterium]
MKPKRSENFPGKGARDPHDLLDRLQLGLVAFSLSFLLLPEPTGRLTHLEASWVYGALVLLFLVNEVLFFLRSWFPALVASLFPRDRRLRLHHPYLDFVALLCVGMVLPDLAFGATVIIAYEIVVLVTRELTEQQLWSLFLETDLNAAQIVAMSFLLLIFVGTLLLMLPFATNDRQGASLIDALFTATSAICVTGLTVRDTGGDFSLFGQLVILALIQIGAFGMMTSSAFLFVLTGRRLKHREGKVMRDLLNVYHTLDIQQMLVGMLSVTLLFELLGTLFLTIAWYPYFHDFSTACYYAFFHAVSAFCNAGFSLFPDSLVRFRESTLVNAVVCTLIIGGGLGFHVLMMLRNRLALPERIGRRRRGGSGVPLEKGWEEEGGGKVRHLDLHSRMVLLMTLLLLGGGTLFFFLSEYDGSMRGFAFFDRFRSAFFLSVTARTAGFNTIDMTRISNSSILLLLLLMFIGASPGSTGGGIKTTTFGVTLFVLRSLLQGRRNILFGNRTIPPSVVNKALAIFITSGLLLTLFLSLLYMVESAPFEEILFEA